ncbi:MAG: leucine-rich repeat domain-containing protein, partial [Oscillospiraceae bacterium]|nr:leucine-rich repeat domain-containing protein [Oscillospiraceae bacterium]
MSKLKRLFAPMLAILIVAAVFFTLPLETQAATSGPYTYTVKNGKATITACDTSLSGDITIPSEIDGYPVTAIGPVAFSSCSNITSVIIPESVTSIGKRAFEQCNSLTSVTLPSGITSISEKVFSHSGLKSIVIPKGV